MKIVYRAALLGLFFVFPFSAWAQSDQPIILVPGILGSWNWDMLSTDVDSDDWDFIPGDTTYDNIISSFEDEGLVRGQDFFIAHYDWRKHNDFSAEEYLMPKIDEALAANSDAEKVDIVAHSMGGLVTRAYTESDMYRDDVDDVVFAGTPHHGSSDVYTLWEGGIVPNNWDKVQQYFINSYVWHMTTVTGETDDAYDTIHTHIPSIQELLPTYDYVKSEDGELVANENMNERNLFLENINSDGFHGERQFEVQKPPYLTNIIGTNQNTVSEIPVVAFDPQTQDEEKLWADGLPKPFPPARNSTNGDNRVLVKSAELPEPGAPVLMKKERTLWDAFANWIVPFAHAQFANPFFVEKEIESGHGALMTNAIPDIFGALNVEQPSDTPDHPEDPEHLMGVWVASPVSVKVVDPNGNEITRTTNTIPGAVYDGEADPQGVKMVLIPEAQSGEYGIELEGLADGQYHVGISHIDNSTSSIHTVQKNVKEGEKVGYTVQYNPDDPETPTEVSEPKDLSQPDDPVVLIAEMKTYIKENVDKQFVRASLIAQLSAVERFIKKEKNWLARFMTGHMQEQVKRHIRKGKITKDVGETIVDDLELLKKLIPEKKKQFFSWWR